MKLPASQALHAYWSGLCKGRRAPDRKDLDPVAMRHMLAQTFILDVAALADTSFRIPLRVSGSRFDALMGHDLRDSCFLALWAQDERHQMRRVVQHVVDDARPAVIGGRACPAGDTPVSFELLLLPLRHEGRTHARVLGSLVLSTTPTWLGLRAAPPLELTSWRMLEEDTQQDRVCRIAAPFERRVHLVVHPGGRAAPMPALKAYVKPALAGSISPG